MNDQIRFLSKRTCADLDLKENWKYHTFAVVKKAIPH